MQKSESCCIPEVNTIWLNITHGFQARMLLRSEISAELIRRGARLVVCVPNGGEAYFRDEFDHPQITLVPMPRNESAIETRISSLRQYVLMNPALGATLNHKREALRRQRPVRYYAARALNLVFGRIGPLRRACMACESALFPGKQYDELLKTHRPDLVVTGTPGFHLQDTHLLRAARRRNIPSATVMLSWDNLSSKGYMNAKPDRLLVWSELMRQEAIEYHEFPDERIEWVGASQFDHYVTHRDRFDVADWRCRHGVANDDALIVYGTINPALLPHEPAIVSAIADAVRDDRFSRPAHLWVRLHPQVVKGVYRNSLEPYLQLQGPRVTVEVPPVRSESLSWDLPATDAVHLADLLAAANVVATPSSTLVIDAACVDTPIVSVQFDVDESVPRELSAGRFLHYTHYARILETSGVAVADSLEDFIDQVDQCANREHRSSGRQNIIRQQLEQLDGQAGLRTAETLLHLMDNTRPGSHRHEGLPLATGTHSAGAKHSMADTEVPR